MLLVQQELLAALALALDGLSPAQGAMFEDDPRNLAVPHALGMRTVLVVPGARVIERDSWELEGGGTHVHHVTDDLAGFLHALR